MRDSDRARWVLRRVRSVPAGSVTTYGGLCPEAPRFAGAVLAQCHDPGVPWHRVVRADGSLPMGEPQRQRLEAEGVPFRGGRVEMAEAWVDIDAIAPELGVKGANGVSGADAGPAGRDRGGASP
jgi:alkylated DNA nucleotide flippase Atl1